MKVLAIDTSGAAATAAVMIDGTLIGEYILNNGKTHSQKLLSIIDRVLEDCGLKPSDIDMYACASGPGSFTGLRIGAATIRGMAHAFDKPVVGVPTLDILAYNTYNCCGLVCPVLDAQRDTVYGALYRWKDNELVKLKDFKVIKADELLELLKEQKDTITVLGDGTAIIAERAKQIENIKIAPCMIQVPRAASCAQLAVKLYEKGASVSYNDFVPNYIRKSQAEDEFEKRMKILIRNMTSEDIVPVHEIEVLSFKTPWSKEAFTEEIHKNNLAKYVVAQIDDRVVGYGGMWQILDEGHITNIAVHPDYRKHKIGEKIVQALIQKAKDLNINRLTLEVRASNDAAIGLYRKLGFTDCGIRKGYYYDTGEDAIIMWKELT
ncbi:MAG: tRNA (adenosine(37)-N6)-threonylcarbamoyltransferase complex dimerization subunit type 1 TsaB [Bacillota bacterium]